MASLVQSASASIGSGTTSGAATFTTANLSSGTKLIAAVCVTGNLRATTGVSDGTNSFTELANIAVGSPGELSIWAIDTPAGDVGTKPAITATFTASSAGAAVLIQEVSGLATGSTLLAMVDGTPGTLTGTGGTSTGSPTYASSAGGEYLTAVYGDASNVGTETWTLPAGYTGDAAGINTNGNAELQIAYKNSTGGTETGSYGRGGVGSAWGVLLLAFKVTATGTSANAGVAAASSAAGAGEGTIQIGMTIRGS